MTKADIAKEVIKYNGGIAKTYDFINAGINRTYLPILCDNGVLHRIRYGTYILATDNNISESKYISSIFPEGIICLYSALFYHGYSDFTPREWTIAFPRTISQRKMKIDVIPFKPYYYQVDNFNLGVTKKNIDGTILSIYDRERTICDCFKYRTKMDSETFIKAINAYVADENKNIINLIKYAKALKIDKKVIEIMGILLNG